MANAGLLNVFLDSEVLLSPDGCFASAEVQIVRSLANEDKLCLLVPLSMRSEFKRKIEADPSRSAHILREFDGFLSDCHAKTLFLEKVPLNDLFSVCQPGLLPLERRGVLKGAVPILELAKWCSDRAEKAVVVSTDPDWEKVCAAYPKLFCYKRMLRDFLIMIRHGDDGKE